MRLSTLNPQPSTLNFLRSTLNPQPSTKKGFTLIELMVVITVIAILASMLTAASLGFIQQARYAATRVTIKKVDEAILARVSAINRWHERDASRLRRDWEQRGWLKLWTAYGLDPFAGTQGSAQGGSPSARMVLSRKWMTLASFPITQSELMQCYWFRARFDRDGTQQYIITNKTRVRSLSGPEATAMATFLTDMNSTQTGNQSLDLPGEIFLYALKNAPVFGGLPMTADDFEDRELIDQDKDGVPELSDAWDQPLRFYRWPTRLVNRGEGFGADWTNNVARQILMPNAPSAPPGTPSVKDPLKQDPDDPAGYLYLNNPMAPAGSPMPIAAYFHDPRTWHAPLVVSAGPDLKLGLAEPNESLPVSLGSTSVPRFGMARPLSVDAPEITGEKILPASDAQGYLYDNITNHTGDGGL